jgi:hypothetical protein
MKMTVKNFELCSAALDFIDELKEKNKKCDGALNSTLKRTQVLDGKTGKKVEDFQCTFHVTYDADLVKEASKPK